MPIIQVLIFRGTGGVQNKAHPHYNEPGLVRAGHVGVAGVIEDKIIGFHPTAAAAEQLGSEERLIKALVRHEPQPGRLQDDTAYFERAYELIEATGGRTIVYTYAVEISDETLAAIQSWYNEKKEAPYNFPNRVGQFQEGESNCAVFWRQFDIPLPVVTGSIKALIRIMSEQDYKQWQPKKSES